MGTIVLRPRSVKLNQGWTLTGAATIQAALSDNTDVSYVQPGPGFLNVDFNDITNQLPDLAQIRSARLSLRVAGNNSAGLIVSWQVRLINGTTPSQTIANFRPRSGGNTYDFNWTPVAPDRTKWSVTGINVTEFVLIGQLPIKVLEAYLSVQYNEAPVTTVTAPSGTVKDDATPTITWDYVDPEGDAQERWQVRIYQAAQTLQAGFSPDSTKPWWDSANSWTRAPSSNAVQVPTAMPPGDWVVYVRTADAGSNGRWGLWDSSAFTLTGMPPAPPTCAVAVDPDNQRTAITVHAFDNLLTRPDSASMDTQASVFWSWVVEQGGTLTTSTVGGGDTTLAALVTSNATSPFRMVTVNRYRVQAGATYTALGTFIQGATARACRVGIRFYDSAHSLIGSTNFGSNVNSSAGGAQASETMAAPVGAVEAALVAEVAGMANAETHKIHLLSLAEGTSLTPYRGGLDSHNVLESESATFEHTVGNWVAHDNCAIAWVSNPGNAKSGNAHLRMTSTAAGTMRCMAGSGSAFYPVTPGQVYTVLASLRASAAGRTGRVIIDWYNANGWTGDPAASAFVALTNGSWTDLALTVTAPDGVIGAALEIQETGVGAGETVDIDAVSLGLGDSTVWKEGHGVRRGPAVEFSDDGGATWAPVRVAARPLFDPLTRTAVVYDYEAPPNTDRKHRARTAVTDPWIPADLVSAPSSAVTSTLPNDIWVLKDPVACMPGLVVSQRGDLSMSAATTQEIAEVQGRPTAVVLSDVPGAEVLALSLTVQGADDWQTFEAMRKAGHALLLQSDMTEQWYVIFTGDRRATLLHSATRKENPARIVEVTATEVERPI